jgi:hypothetical protein
MHSYCPRANRRGKSWARLLAYITVWSTWNWCYNNESRRVGRSDLMPLWQLDFQPFGCKQILLNSLDHP